MEGNFDFILSPMPQWAKVMLLSIVFFLFFCILGDLYRKIQTKIIENPEKALAYAKKIIGKGDLAVVSGSIYLVGEVVPQIGES